MSFVEKKNPNIRRGRGANVETSNRFETTHKEVIYDGWQEPEEQPIKTEYIKDFSKSILTRNQSPDIPFDRSINPYRGCEHGCIYCFARPTHAFLGHSAGIEFEGKIYYKNNALKLLHKALSQSQYAPKPIAFGTNTDPYQPAEKSLKITRTLFEYLLELRHPITITTKGALILRDLDLLEAFAEQNLILVNISVTTLDSKLHRLMEPRAMSPHNRLAVLSKLAERNIPCGVLIAPMIPKLNDHELENIMENAKSSGAEFAHFMPVRLPLEVAPIFESWLDEYFPDRKAKILAAIASLHEGKLDKSEFYRRFRGSGHHAALLQQRYQIALKKFGFTKNHIKLDCSKFEKPSKDFNQMKLI